jgi:hypothetical protein
MPKGYGYEMSPRKKMASGYTKAGMKPKKKKMAKKKMTKRKMKY